MNTEFTKNGFLHQQIKREGQVAIFARSKNRATHFEVVRIMPHGPYELAGVQFPAGENYPSSEQWGARGWTYRDMDGAEERFDSLTGK